MKRFIYSFATVAAFLAGFLGTNFFTKNEIQEERDFVRKRAEWFYEQRAFGLGYIPTGAREAAIQFMHDQMPVLSFSKRNGTLVGAWTQIGPANVAGRITSIVIDPANPNIYVATADGGVWKTTDGGLTWAPLTDNLETLTSGVLTYDAKNRVLYYASGEANNSIDSYGGTGVFKSTDRGVTWTKLTSVPVVNSPPNTGPTYYSSSVFAVDTLKGRVWLGFLRRRQGQQGFNGALYKSTDGGTSWTRMDPPDQFGNPTGPLIYPFLSDFVFDPVRTDTAYAAVGNASGNPPSPFSQQGIYKTTNGGSTWIAVTNGLPVSDSLGRISLAISRSIPNVLFASIALPSPPSFPNHGALAGIYKTTDGGASWTKVYTPSYSGTLADNWLGDQGWYNNVIAVHPTDTSIVYAGGINLMKSTNGGRTWTTIADWTINANGNINSPHADHHAFAFHPSNPNIIFTGNDGGLFTSTDGGVTWSHLNNGVTTTQFYSIALNPKNRSKAHGGTQDNGTLKYTGVTSWTKIYGGDGGFVALDFFTPETLFTEYVYLAMQRSFNGGTNFTQITSGINLDQSTGERIAFYAPYNVSKSSPAIMYAGTQRMWKSTNRGTNWTSTSTDLTYGTGVISAISVAPSDPNHVYVGTSDGRILSSSNGGTSWDSTTTYPLGTVRRFVKDFAVHPTDPNTAYVTFSGYNTDHVFKTTNHGASWTSISAGLPDIPVNAVALHPRFPTTVLFIATDIGCMVSTNGGSSWASLGTGLPNVVVQDIAVSEDASYIRAATHGRSVWELTDVPTDVAEGSPFNIVKTYELFQNYPNPFNPSTVIKFDLPRSEKVSLKIYDVTGREVATLIDDELSVGHHIVQWNGKNTAQQPVASGIYYYRLQTQNFTKTNKMVLIK